MDQLQPRDLGQQGLGAALGRSEAKGTSAPGIVTSLAEALWWVAALDDHHEAAFGSVDYFQTIRVGDGGETVAGLVWARNLVGHELVTITTLFETLLTSGDDQLTWGGERLTWGTPSWLLRADLPAPRRKENHARDQMYDKHVAGRPIAEPFTVAHDWFLALPDPPS
jgi:hypothetical protein